MVDFDEGLNLVRNLRNQGKEWPAVLQALQGKPHSIPEAQAQIFVESIQAEEERSGGPIVLDPREMPTAEPTETVHDLLTQFTEPTGTGSIEDSIPVLEE